MNLHDRAVQTHRFDLDADELFTLQLGKQTIQNAGLRPAVHARVDRVPVAKALRQRTPLTAVLCDKQDRIDDVEVLVRNVASLSWQVRLDARVLFGCYLHPGSISVSVNRP